MVAAGDLAVGDEIYQLDGSIAVVTGSQFEKLDVPVKVYNLNVEDFHSYFVGDVPVLVHNYGGSSDDTPNTLYHYTNEKGQNAILESNELKPSLKANNPNDARFGDGQYLSDLLPDEYSPIQLASRFIHRPNRYKYTHFIEILVEGLNVVKGRDGVYVIPNQDSLDLTGRIIRWGKVGS